MIPNAPRKAVKRAPLVLPPRGHLRATSPVDYVERYYGIGLATVLRQRLRWVRQVLPAEGCGTLLEIGYGSGVLMYELARHADRLIGIDIHPHGADVRRRCAADGVTCAPVQGDGTALPFADLSIDIVVILSALEFMADPAACISESFRVLKPGGRIIAVTPRVHPWADTLWRAFSGVDPETEFRGGRQRVQRALEQTALIAERSPRPRRLPRALAPYDLVVIRRFLPRPERRSKPHRRVDSGTYRTI
jgi:SAM-dependent methyltransferase